MALPDRLLVSMHKKVTLFKVIEAILVLFLCTSVFSCSDDEKTKTKTKKTKSESSKGRVSIKPGKLSERQSTYLKLDAPALLSVPKARWVLETDAENTKCAKSRSCKQNGQCAQISLRRSPTQLPIEVKCVSLDRQLCLQSVDCLQKGQCTPKEGLCVVESNLDCFQSQRCRTYGLCNADNGACVAKSNSDCERSLACQDFQACTFKAGLCVNQEDTKQKCQYGCVYTQGGCFCDPNPPPIRARKDVEPACIKQCRKLGNCALKDQGCAPRNTQDCELSEACKTHGKCAYKDGVCELTTIGCATSLLCSLVGQCNLINGACLATSEDDCRSSRACAERESCHFKPRPRSTESSTVPSDADGQGDELIKRILFGECVLPKKQQDCTDLCKRLGQCEVINGVCLAASRARCIASQVCKKYGHCTPRRGKCIATSVRDCKRGQTCTQFGYCKPYKGRCVKP
jgi:hypothetical protein